MNIFNCFARVEYADDDIKYTQLCYEELMGYTTDFTGRFNLDKPLTEAHAAYLKGWADSRRMKRDVAKTAKRSDPLRKAVGLPLGVEGEFFAGETGYAGQDRGDDVIDGNNAPSTQPGLWCQWEPSEDRKSIEWDGSEKFYNYVEWINYVIENFLKPWGYKLSGEVTYQGEDHDDNGRLVIVAGICKTNPSSLVRLAECAGDLTEDSFEDS